LRTPTTPGAPDGPPTPWVFKTAPDNQTKPSRSLPSLKIGLQDISRALQLRF
jgi:hypothetical protein